MKTPRGKFIKNRLKGIAPNNKASQKGLTNADKSTTRQLSKTKLSQRIEYCRLKKTFKSWLKMFLSTKKYINT